MKKQIIFLAALATVVTLSNSSCKKKDAVKSKTKTELITSAAWKYQSAGIDSDNNGTIDFPIPNPPALGSLPACQTDNVSTLVSNGSGTIDEGPTKCAPADPQTATFSWAFQNNETEINFTGAALAGQSGVFKIITLNETNLVLSQQRTISGLGLVTVIATFKH